MSDQSEDNVHPRDVRMRGFARRSTVEEVLGWIDELAHSLPPHRTELRHAAGRVLAEEIVSQRDVPAFPRAMMDGYALHAADTLGATSYNSLSLRIVGEVLPGRNFPRTVKRGEAVRIMTGAPLPDGTDAVLPAEHAHLAHLDGPLGTTQHELLTAANPTADDSSVPGYGQTPDMEGSADHVLSQSPSLLLVSDEVPPRKHVGRIGEDVTRGTRVLSAGRRLRPQDLGLLSSVGYASISVVRRPRVRLVVTGNELCEAGAVPEPFQTVDANSPMLAALVERDGGELMFPGLTLDDPESIREAMQDPAADVVIVSGGSSVGQEDHAPRILADVGLLRYHGIAMRPSSPAGMGLIDGRPVFLLPGNPVSCLCAYDFFAGRAIRLFGGRSAEWPYPRSLGRLERKLSSVVGRLDYARVMLRDGRVDPIAIAGASVLSSLTRADGFVVIPADSEGFPPESEVEVFLYDQIGG